MSSVSWPRHHWVSCCVVYVQTGYVRCVSIFFFLNVPTTLRSNPARPSHVLVLLLLLLTTNCSTPLETWNLQLPWAQQRRAQFCCSGAENGTEQRVRINATSESFRVQTDQDIGSLQLNIFYCTNFNHWNVFSSMRSVKFKTVPFSCIPQWALP